MKYQVQNQGTVSLTDQNFLAEGGEGKVYTIGGTAYKIYTNQPPPINKVQQLQTLSHKSIVNPQALVYDARNNYVGFSMRYVKDTLALCRLFVTDFLNRNNITPKQLTELVGQMREVFEYIHANRMLVVDANENNFLIREGEWTTPYFIDVLNWQTDQFPANAIMPSIQDHHTKGFNVNTDWFSFAVLTCQLYTGIHPYKGFHDDYKRNDFLGRMKDNVSIFNPKVRLPSVVRDFALIPNNLLDWYKAVLEKGERSAPPVAFDGPKPVVLKPTTQSITSQNFNIQLVGKFDQELERIVQANAQTAYFLRNNVVFNRINYPKKEIFFGINSTYWIEGNQEKISFYNLKGEPAMSLPINHKAMLVVDNTIYVVADQRLSQLAIYEGQQDRVMVKQNWPLLPGSTNVYDNMLIINALGKKVMVLLDEKRATVSLVSELDGGKVVNAKYLNHVAIVVTEKKGVLSKHIIRWKADFSSYTIWNFDNVSTADINFTVLDNGISVCIAEDGLMQVFNNNPEAKQIKEIHDQQILSKMRLTKYNSRIHFVVDNQLYSLSMR